MTTDRAGRKPVIAKIRMLMGTKLMKQGQLGLELGLNASVMSKLMDEERDLRIHEARVICRLFGVSMDWLSDPNATEIPPPRGEGTGIGSITSDQKFILELIDDLGLDRRQAVMALTAAGRPSEAATQGETQATQGGASRPVPAPVQALKPVGRETFEGPAEPDRNETGKGKGAGKTRAGGDADRHREKAAADPV